MTDSNLRYVENTQKRGLGFFGAHSHARHKPPSGQQPRYASPTTPFGGDQTESRRETGDVNKVLTSVIPSPRKPWPEQDLAKLLSASDAHAEAEGVVSLPRWSTHPKLFARQSPQDWGMRNLSLEPQKGPKKRLSSFSDAFALQSQRSGSSSKAARPLVTQQSDGHASPHSHANKVSNSRSAPRRSNLDAFQQRPDATFVTNQPAALDNFFPEIQGHKSGPVKTPKRQRQNVASTRRRDLKDSTNAEISLSGASNTHAEPKSASSFSKEELRNSCDYEPPEENYTITLLKQPDARPISEDQLAAEVKGIYAGLVMVEAKCLNVVATQTLALQDSAQSGRLVKLHTDHWQALIALHRTLLHEHHDFFLASQHPSASATLRDLASRYSMPARMWKHGIHSFLELLRRWLPDSLEFMITFIYLSYQMIALLYETVPSFEETWVECLGDLSRYRMAVEEGDMKDREVWTATARYWYSKAANVNPGIGRLHHHLAILARNSPLQQLSLYSRSLCSEQPFAAGRDSILTVLEPIMFMDDPAAPKLPPAEYCFIKLHSILFTGQEADSFNDTLTTFLRQLDIYIGRITTKWKLLGAYIAITNVCALLKYGSDASPLWRFFSDTQSPSRALMERSVLKSLPPREWQLFNATFSLVLSRVGDRNVLAFVHVMLAFLLRFSGVAYDLIDDGIPWTELASFLNSFAKLQRLPDHIHESEFISERDPKPKALPEDYTMRGQLWAASYFPKSWFAEEAPDLDERGMETQSHGPLRTERVLWLGVRLAARTRFLHFDNRTNSFSTGS